MRAILIALLLSVVFATTDRHRTHPPGHNVLFGEQSDLPIRVTPRTKAPAFSAMAVLPDQKFAKVALSDYTLRGKWVVLLFYPFDFTFVCPTEIISFSEQAASFAQVNAQTLAISTDSHHTHLAWVRTPRKDGGLGETHIPLVADTSKTISKAYGVLVEDEHDDMYGAALRGLFLIDPKGTIRAVSIHDDHVGRNVEETLRLIQAFQYADEHGEVCPANWHPGEKTIKPDPVSSKEYFRAVNKDAKDKSEL
jgi:peroxiredoxin (alkyl hydroperoxide reductase subunit C)